MTPLTDLEFRDHLRRYGWVPALYKGVDVMVVYPWEQKAALARWEAEGRLGTAPPMQYQMGGNSRDLALLGDGRVLRQGMECTFTNRSKVKVRGIITRIIMPYGAEGGMLCRFSYKLKNGHQVEDHVTMPADITPTRIERWKP